MKGLLDIINVKKYIAQHKWHKLCIIFKLRPELTQFHSYGFYIVNYIVSFPSRDRFHIFRNRLDSYFSRDYSSDYDSHCKYTSKDNNIIYQHIRYSNDYTITIKKCELFIYFEKLIKSIILKCKGRVIFT